MAAAVNQPHREASIRLQGQTPVVVAGADRPHPRPGGGGARRSSSRSLARRVPRRSRCRSPSMRPTSPPQTSSPWRHRSGSPFRLRSASRSARTRFRLPRYRIAEMLDPPSAGRRDLRIAGPGADAFFVRLQRQIGRAPRDADFAVTSHGIRVVPARVGQDVDVPATAARDAARRAVDDEPCRAPRRRRHTAEGHDRRREGDGNQGHRRLVHHRLRRRSRTGSTTSSSSRT